MYGTSDWNVTKTEKTLRRILRALPVTADGVPIVPGMQLYSIYTVDGGKLWHVRPTRIDFIGPMRSIRFDGQDFWEHPGPPGDNRNYASKAKANREAKRRTKAAA